MFPFEGTDLTGEGKDGFPPHTSQLLSRQGGNLPDFLNIACRLCVEKALTLYKDRKIV